MRKSLVRTSIVFFWVVIIFAALYWPKWKPFHYKQNSINIFSWGDILDPTVIGDFEKKTGIKVNLNYYSSNEELLVKMKATKGEGYDLIIPSDYAVQLLSKENLLKKLDPSRFHFWKDINPVLTHLPFDPDNSYSIPFEWEIFGLGIDTNYFQNKQLNQSWKLIYDPSIINYKITMINDPVEAILFTSFYLYGLVDSLEKEQVQSIKNLLFRQKKWVEAYADFRGDYFLATKNCPVVVSSSSYIWRTMRNFKFVGFVVPQEGTFITIENLCIPLASNKETLAYEFINYLFKAESVAAHYKTFGFFPSTMHALHLMDLDPLAEKLIRSTPQDFEKFHLTKVLLPQQQIRDIWVEVKTKDD
ncbi:MAG TPA: extracellular solute-binding protein [Rhabdochlamydiaceae bacterium]|nr:extracellular solute-binding protein [Rhabdochlamydiaceae bacterium]